MKVLRLTKAFSIWLTKAFFEKVRQLNREFKKDLQRHTGITICFWIIISILWAGGLGFTIVSLFGSTIGFTVGMCSAILYLVYAIFSNLYALFKRDRRELFETIKNS